MKLYFDVGTPRYHDTVIDGATFELEPRLVSLSIQVGSLGGSLIVARVEGLGQIASTAWEQSGVMLANNATGALICQNGSVASYGVVHCLTNGNEVPAASTISLYLYKYQQYHPCYGSDASLCVYEQLASTPLPAFTAVDNSVTNKIVFTGTNFFTADYVANVSYGGADADTVTVDTATQVTATWTLGMPPLGEALIP